MSRQLALSASFSIFAMALFALSQSGSEHLRPENSQTGAAAHAAAPAFDERRVPLFPFVMD